MQQHVVFPLDNFSFVESRGGFGTTFLFVSSKHWDISNVLSVLGKERIQMDSDQNLLQSFNNSNSFPFKFVEKKMFTLISFF